MYGPLLRDLLGLKELAHALAVSSVASGEQVTVDRVALADLIEQLSLVAQHADAEAKWRTSMDGQTALLTLHPSFYGPRRRAVE